MAVLSIFVMVAIMLIVMMNQGAPGVAMRGICIYAFRHVLLALVVLFCVFARLDVDGQIGVVLRRAVHVLHCAVHLARDEIDPLVH